MDRNLLCAAVALAHAVPGARLDLDVAGSSAVVAASDGDISTAQLRCALIAEARCAQVDCSRFIEGVSLRGSLVELGAGIALVRGARRERAFASLLGPTVVASLAASIVDAGPVTPLIDADRELGVTVVRLVKTRDGSSTAALDDVTLALSAVCLAGEIERGLFAPLHRGHG